VNALAIKCYFFLIGPLRELMLSKFSEGGPIIIRKQLRVMGKSLDGLFADQEHFDPRDRHLFSDSRVIRGLNLGFHKGSTS
jgi:hypothetical protein